MTSPAPPSGGGGATMIVPIVALGLGSYLMWFGVKYWRGEGLAVWPSYPIKSALQGQGVPPNTAAASTQDQLTAVETAAMLGSAGAAAGAQVNTPPGGTTSTTAADANRQRLLAAMQPVQAIVRGRG